jgi:hypothetical protein
MFENRYPDLKCVIRVLSIDFVKTKPIVHTLLDKANVLVIADFKPVVHFLFDPLLFKQNVKANFRPHKSRYKRITLSQQVLLDVIVSFV